MSGLLTKTVLGFFLVAGLSCSPRRSGLNPSSGDERSDQSPSSRPRVSATIVMKPRVVLFRRANLNRQVQPVCDKVPACLQLCQDLKQENCTVPSARMVEQWLKHIRTYKTPEEVQKDLHGIATNKDRADFLKNTDRDHQVLVTLLTRGPSDNCPSFERQAVSLKHSPYAALYLKKPVDEASLQEAPASAGGEVAEVLQEDVPLTQADYSTQGGEQNPVSAEDSELTLPLVGPPAPASEQPPPAEDSVQKAAADETEAALPPHPQPPASSSAEADASSVAAAPPARAREGTSEEEDKFLSPHESSSEAAPPEAESEQAPASLEAAILPQESPPSDEDSTNILPVEEAPTAAEVLDLQTPDDGILLSQGANISLNGPVFMGFSKKCFEGGSQIFSQLAAVHQNSSAVQAAHELLSDACSGQEACIRLAYCEVEGEDPLWSFVPEDIKSKGCDYESFLKPPLKTPAPSL